MAPENNIPRMNQDKSNGPKKGPRFNIYWIYGIIAVGLLLMQVMNLHRIYCPQMSRNSSRKC